MSHQYSDFFFDGDYSVRRRRVLDDFRNDTRSILDDPVDREEATQQYLNSIYETYESASDKASIIMEYAERVARKYTIPVPEGAAELRKSVARQDPDSDEGAIITFDLFQSCIDIIESQAERVDYRVINTKVIDEGAESRTIQKLIDKRLDDDDSLAFLALFAVQFTTLWAISEITGIWRAAEIAESVSTFAKAQRNVAKAAETIAPIAGSLVSIFGGPTLGAAAAAVAENQNVYEPIAVKIALEHSGTAVSTFFTGLAISLAIGVFDELMLRLLLTEGQPDVDTETEATISGIISTAKQTELPPLVGKMRTAMGINDYMAITRYVIKFISKSPDRGYDFWYAYFMSRRSRHQVNRSLSHAPMFSKERFARNNYGWDVDGPLVNPDDIGVSDPLLSGGGLGLAESLGVELIGDLRNAIVRPMDDYACVMDREASAVDKGLDFMAQVLDTRLSRDVICCFIAVFGKIDTKVLKAISAILNLRMNALVFDMNLVLNNYIAKLVVWVVDAVIKQVLALIQMIFDKVIKLILDFITQQMTDLEFLIRCPLVMQVIQAIIDAINIIKRDLEEVVSNYLHALGFELMISLSLEDVGNSKSALHRVYKKRWMRAITRLLDAIISALDEGAYICADRDEEDLSGIPPDSVITLDELVGSALVDDLDDYLEIPADVRASHFPTAVEYTFQDGTKLPAYDVGELSLADGYLPDEKIATCLHFFTSNRN